jgi:hypothetical protein
MPRDRDDGVPIRRKTRPTGGMPWAALWAVIVAFGSIAVGVCVGVGGLLLHAAAVANLPPIDRLGVKMGGLRTLSPDQQNDFYVAYFAVALGGLAVVLGTGVAVVTAILARSRVAWAAAAVGGLAVVAGAALAMLVLHA